MTTKRVETAGAESSLRAVPRGVWVLGFVSLFMDTSSELLHSLTPVLLVNVLGSIGDPETIARESIRYMRECEHG